MNSLQHRLKVLAVCAPIGMLWLLLGGALVTKTDSGDGCGSSWPLCNGELFPSVITTELIIEISHRITTVLVSFLILAFVYYSWKLLGHLWEIKFLSILSIAFIVIQSLIGAANVVWGQSDFFLALHFGISLISFAGIFLMTLIVFEAQRKDKLHSFQFDKRMKFHTIGVTIFSMLVIYSGALVQHTESSFVCLDWPFCNNESIGLPNNFYEWVHMGHRGLAGLFFLWIGYITFFVNRSYKKQPPIFYSWIAAFILVIMQVTSGAFVIFTKVSLEITLLHSLFITCLFGILSNLVFQIYRNWVNENRSQKSVSIQELKEKPV